MKQTLTKMLKEPWLWIVLAAALFVVRTILVYN